MGHRAAGKVLVEDTHGKDTFRALLQRANLTLTTLPTGLIRQAGIAGSRGAVGATCGSLTNWPHRPGGGLSVAQRPVRAWLIARRLISHRY